MTRYPWLQLAVGLVAAPLWGEPLPPDGPPTVEQMAQRCARRIHEIAEHFNIEMRMRTNRCVTRIDELQEAGLSTEAEGVADRCSHSVNHIAGRGVNRITIAADNCLEKLTMMEAPEDVKQRVREATARALNAIRDQADRALAAIGVALSD